MKKFTFVFIRIFLICTFFLLSTVTEVFAYETVFPYVFTDSLGKKIIINEKPETVVSLMGSYAETWTLAGGAVLGVTVDAVKERNMNLPDNVMIIGSVKAPNLEQILNLEPDLVILSSDIDGHLKAIPILENSGITCAAFKVEGFLDYLEMLEVFTNITGREDLYLKNGLAVQIKINEIISKVKNSGKKPSVLFLRAFSTGIKAKGSDNLTGMILKDIGADNIVSKHASMLESLSMETIIMEDPDYIFIVAMGEESDKTLESLYKEFRSNPAWSNLSAIKNDYFFILPKELFHYKPNARWGESYEYLAKIIYPQLF